MADIDELYAKNKKAQKRIWIKRLVALVAKIAVAVPIFLIISKDNINDFSDQMIYAYVSLLLAGLGVAAAMKFLSKNEYEKIDERIAENLTSKPEKTAANTANSALSADLKNLENERVQLAQTIDKADTIAVISGLILGGLVASFFDVAYGIISGVATHMIIKTFMTSAKKQKFASNFKKRLISAIVKKHGLTYKEHGGLSIDEFFTIYDCRVDEWCGEDLIYGKIDGVSVKFSDFYAVKKVKTKNSTRTEVQFQGVLFVADFHKKLSGITQVCHAHSRNLASYGDRAKMDDARFEEFFNVYATDQISARYALTPLLMQKFTELHLKFNAPINAVFKESKIYIAVETDRNNFEPSAYRSFNDSDTIAFYESEIAGFMQIVKEIKLNRQIWGDS